MKNKINLNKILLILTILTIASTSIVYAETTSAKLHFCEYPGTLRALKILGFVLTIVKIVLPIIIIIVSSIDFAKIAINGKSDDLMKTIPSLAKRLIAAFVIFLLPSLLDFAFTTLVDNDTSKFTECTTCIFDTENCEIPEENPNVLGE